MRVRLLLSFILIFIPAALFSQNESLSGYITGPDAAYVAGATIVLKGTTLGTMSDKNGYYRLGRLNRGTYTLRVSYLGYETLEKTITVGSGENRADFSVREASIDLNEVVVTGTKSEKTIKNVPVITQVISARKMLDLGITSASDALQTMVPGLNMSQYGTRASITLNGMNSKYVLFLIDGERIAGEINGDIDYSMLNLENIDRIEIIKGASSSLYGSNAIGGVINIITKKINEPFDAKFYSKYSKYNEFYTGGSIGLKKGIVGSRTSFNYSHTDGYDLTPLSTHDWTQNPYYSLSINQKFQITPSSRLSFVPYFTYYQFERGNVSARPAHDLNTDFNAGLKGEYYFGNHSVDFSYYRDRYNTFTILEQLNNQKSIASYNNVQTVRVQGNFHFSEKNVLTAGLEFNDEYLYSLRIDDGLKAADEAVFYLQEDFMPGKKLEIIAGIRTSAHSTYGFNAAPKISLMYKAGAVNFRGSVGTGFRSPSLKELYMNFDHFGEWYIVGNKSLKPESSMYISASAEFSKPWNNSSVSVYRNVLKDMITDRWLPDTTLLTRQYQNIASASVYGLDLISKQKILKGLWISAGYSYVHSYDNETQLQLYGTTKHSGNIAADYNFRLNKYSFSAQVYGKLMGEKFYENTADGVPPDKPYNSWRFTLSGEYKWLRLSAGIDNIFNIIIPENIDFISPGRRFFVGMNVDFGKIELPPVPPKRDSANY
jgi:outer membrane receptor for ferrienterochelin and colicins